MKTRHGFVSNSSSSSFVVGFKNLPKTEDELRKMMFGDIEAIEEYDHSMTTEAVAQRVFADLQKTRPLTRKQIIEELTSGWLDAIEKAAGIIPFDHSQREDEVDERFEKKYGKYADWRKYPDWEKERQKAWEDDWKDYDARRMTVGTAFWDKQQPEWEGLTIYCFSYADENGETVLEHGDIFRNLKHIQISHH